MRKVCNIDGQRVMKEVGETAELDDATASGFVESGWAKWPDEKAPPPVENREQDLLTETREAPKTKRAKRKATS